MTDSKVSLNSQSQAIRDAREKIARDIAEFQQRGGKINQVASNVMAGKSQTPTGGRAGIYE